jgi:amidophosphoribosyltransferase
MEECVVASETCALDLVQAEYIRDVEPGEISLSTRRA